MGNVNDIYLKVREKADGIKWLEVRQLQHKWILEGFNKLCSRHHREQKKLQNNNVDVKSKLSDRAV